METILRTAFIYIFLLVILRVSGKRTLAQITVFDFVLVLLISEAVQQAMIGSDTTLAGGVLAVVTLIGLELILTIVKQKNKGLDKLIEGEPVVIVENGKPIKHRLEKERIDEEEILEEARRLQGIERMSQIKYAILEKSGGISIIPAEKPSASAVIVKNDNEEKEKSQDSND